MESMIEQPRLSQAAMRGRVRSELPHLSEVEAEDVSRIVDTLTRAFCPDQIYVFGSQARGTRTWHSDVDLLVVMPSTGEFPHRLAQQAYREVGRHVLPLEVVFMGREEFDWRSQVVTSLPATVLREGRLLYGNAF